MCGINVIAGINSNLSKDKLEFMQSYTSHRGPDNSGTIFLDDVAFGHNRLSIIDLDNRANQPFEYKNLILVFNGEIYNYKTLIEEHLKDVELSTSSDTEVLAILLYKYWSRAIDFLEGMFAFVVFNKDTGVLLFARDRVGEKPLFYKQYEEKIYISSEAFPLNDGAAIEINHDSIFYHLTSLIPGYGESYFNGINKVRAGYYYEFNLRSKSLIEKRYWNHLPLQENKNQSFSEIKNNIERIYSNSLAICCSSDVPLTFALSGGIDSTLNILYAKNKLNIKNILAVNVSMNGADAVIDESLIALETCSKFGIDLLPVKLDFEDFWALNDELQDKLSDCPVLWPDMVLTYAISKEMKSLGRKVLIVGEGADELFAYPGYAQEIAKYNLVNKYKLPYLLLKKFGLNINGFQNRLSTFDVAIPARSYHAFSQKKIESIYCKRMPMSILDLHLKNDFDSYVTEANGGCISKINSIEYRSRLPELLCARLDYAGMLSSVEIRSPYLNHKLIDYSLSTSYTERNKGSEKKILKDMLLEVSNNQFNVDRKKTGFGVEFQSKLLAHLENKIAGYSSNSPVAQFVDLSKINKLSLGEAWALNSVNSWLKKYG